MELQLKVDYEMADKITRHNLVDMYRNVEAEIESLEAKAEDRELKDHEKVDLYDSQKHKRELAAVLSFMSIKTDLEEYGLADLCRW
jgi:hypothetical protein